MIIDPFSAVVIALATFRLTRIVTTDVVLERPRNWLWSKFPPSTMFGYLLTCDWCFSVWVGSLVVFCYTIVPLVTFWVALVFALSAVTGFLARMLDR